MQQQRFIYVIRRHHFRYHKTSPDSVFSPTDDNIDLNLRQVFAPRASICHYVILSVQVELLMCSTDFLLDHGKAKCRAVHISVSPVGIV